MKRSDIPNNISQNIQSIRPIQSTASTNCMICNAPLEYHNTSVIKSCFYCNQQISSNASCRNGHFVCDTCHAGEAVAVIAQICQHTGETDMITLLKKLRAHPAAHLHGPEHHVMVPAIIVSTYRNLGGAVKGDMLATAIERAGQVAGGFCGFMGACGAAVGIGIGFSVLLEGTPLTPAVRQLANRLTGIALREISAVEAARCCQRDCAVSLNVAARESAEILPVPLRADDDLRCSQVRHNKECIHRVCPFFPPNVKKSDSDRG